MRADGQGRRLAVLVSAVGLLLLTNGPALTLSIRVMHRPFTFEDWPFAVPCVGLGGLGVWRIAQATASGQLTGLRRSALWTSTATAGWVVVAACFSDLSPFTPQRVLMFCSVVAFGSSLSLHSLGELLVATTMAFNAATLASAGAVVRFPIWARSSRDVLGRGDYFQGIFANRNSLGPVAGLAFLCALAWLFHSRVTWARWLGGGLLLVDGWMLVGSHSASPVVGLAVAVALVGIALAASRAAARWNLDLWIAAALGGTTAVVAGLTTYLGRATLSSVIGRGADLSGRGSIWADVAHVVQRRPWTGYGLGAFWETDMVWPLYEHQGWVQFGSAHNSFLELSLAAGWIGGALLFLTAGMALVSSVLMGWRFGRWTWWMLAVTGFLLVELSTESFVLFYSSFVALLIALAVKRGEALDRPTDPPALLVIDAQTSSM